MCVCVCEKETERTGRGCGWDKRGRCVECRTMVVKYLHKSTQDEQNFSRGGVYVHVHIGVVESYVHKGYMRKSVHSLGSCSCA